MNARELSPGSAPAPAATLPRLAGQLGHAGLLPFAAGAVLVWLVQPEAHPYAVAMLAGYAAVIVSFLGGIHWGAVFAQAAGVEPSRHLFWGVVPSLVAWPAVLMPPMAGLVVLGAMLWVCYAVDRKLYPALGLQAWLGLRFRLSAVAGLCCFIGAAGA
jgi:hypothetical protein